MSQSFRWNALQKFLLAVWAMATVVLLFVVILLIREMARSGRDPADAFQVAERPASSEPPPNTSRSSSLGEREIQLFFAASDGHSLVPEKRMVPFTESTADNCKTALQALIQGPQSDASPILPPSVGVKALFLRSDGELVINFTRELQTEHARSSSAMLESLLVQGVAQTLAQNALQNVQDVKVRRVRFLIEDEVPGESFPAHIDLHDAVAPDGRWLTAQD